jgi:hypothetical protein
MTRRSLLGRVPSGMQSVLAWSACGACDYRRGACGARACCALYVDAVFRHCGQPGHHARTCLLNRQGTAVAAHPHACFSKRRSSTASCTPLQRLWGSKAHTRAHTYTFAHTHTLTRMCTDTHTITNARSNTHRRAHTRTHAYAHTLRA